MLPYELKRVRELGYAVFEGPYNLNVIGLRGPNRNQSQSPSDDELMILYQNRAGRWIREAWPCTTDPTLKYLKRPLRTIGAAILVTGQHRGMWRLGLHRGRRALVQNRPVRVWRDGNRDEILDFDFSDDGVSGSYGINLHDGRGSSASAGCQVVPFQRDVDRIRWLVKKQAELGNGGTVSYLLLDREKMYPTG